MLVRFACVYGLSGGKGMKYLCGKITKRTSNTVVITGNGLFFLVKPIVLPFIFDITVGFDLTLHKF